MEINKIQSALSVKKNGISHPAGISRDKPSLPLASDRVEITEANNRAVILDSIRAKIKQGFYGSDEVTDDVSEKLAHLFDR
jgi:hypothetical protein